MTASAVTIVVVPRDHFSHARDSLESVLELTPPPYTLIYVDGGAPRYVRRYLAERAAARGFRLIRTECFLSPNRARNIGLREATTRYVVFLDNDVVVAPHWLPPLVDCAETTGATIVTPLNCAGLPLHEMVHFAGGETGVREVVVDGRTERHLVDRIHAQGRRVVEVRESLRRAPTGVAEFHCMLVRRDVFAALGALDERLLSTRENLDFCMAVTRAGGSIHLEPASVITYLPPLALAWSDMPYFMLRWSDRWDLASFRHLRDKWQLTENAYFQRQYAGVGWRRRSLLIRPLMAKIRPAKVRAAMERVLRALDRAVNPLIADGYARRQARSVASAPASSSRETPVTR